MSESASYTLGFKRKGSQLRRGAAYLHTQLRIVRSSRASCAGYMFTSANVKTCTSNFNFPTEVACGFENPVPDSRHEYEASETHRAQQHHPLEFVSDCLREGRGFLVFL